MLQGGAFPTLHPLLLTSIQSTDPWAAQPGAGVAELQPPGTEGSRELKPQGSEGNRVHYKAPTEPSAVLLAPACHVIRGKSLPRLWDSFYTTKRFHLTLRSRTCPFLLCQWKPTVTANWLLKTEKPRKGGAAV